MTNIATLAKSMDVSETDLLCFARSIANSIETDGCSDVFRNASSSQKIEISQAYAIAANRKIKQFHTKILVSEEAKKLFCLDILNKLKTRIQHG